MLAPFDKELHVTYANISFTETQGTFRRSYPVIFVKDIPVFVFHHLIAVTAITLLSHSTPTRVRTEDTRVKSPLLFH